jgi:hypothetical protein
MKDAYQTLNVNLSFDSETGILQLTWIHFTPTQEYHEALEKALDLMHKYKARRWIFDQRNAEVISVADQRWVVDDWTPRVIQAVGLKPKSAVILAKNIFGEMGIRNLVDATHDEVITKYFQEMESAKKWLLE